MATRWVQVWLPESVTDSVGVPVTDVAQTVTRTATSDPDGGENDAVTDWAGDATVAYAGDGVDASWLIATPGPPSSGCWRRAGSDQVPRAAVHREGPRTGECLLGDRLDDPRAVRREGDCGPAGGGGQAERVGRRRLDVVHGSGGQSRGQHDDLLVSGVRRAGGQQDPGGGRRGERIGGRAAVREHPGEVPRAARIPEPD